MRKRDMLLQRSRTINRYENPCSLLPASCSLLTVRCLLLLATSCLLLAAGYWMLAALLPAGVKRSSRTERADPQVTVHHAPHRPFYTARSSVQHGPASQTSTRTRRSGQKSGEIRNFALQTRNSVSKTRNSVLNTIHCALMMMNSAGHRCVRHGDYRNSTATASLFPEGVSLTDCMLSAHFCGWG